MNPATDSAARLLRVVRESEDASMVRAALMQLGYGKQKAIYQVLVEKLDDPNPSIQHAAVVALGRHGRPEAIEELVKPKTLQSPYHQVRWAAVTAIGRLGDHRVIDYLLRAAEDPEWIVRTAAVTELMAKIRDIVARKDFKMARILVYMFSLNNDEVVNLAADGLLEMALACGAPCVCLLHEALRNPLHRIRAQAARVLGRMKSRNSVPFLLEILEDEEADVRASAVEALGAVRDPAAVEPLVQTIQDNVEVVREKAVAALAGFGPAATPSLVGALVRERDKFALKAFLKCLGLIGDPKSVPALIQHLRSSYFVVRQSSFEALVRFGRRVVEPLLATLTYNTSDIRMLLRDACDSEHPELQVRAVSALGGLEDHRAVGVLKEQVDAGTPEVQEVASKALFRIGCAAWGRSSALRVLAEVGDISIVRRILPSLKDDSDNVRFEAVRVLGRLGGQEAVRNLVRMALKDRCDFIRREAVSMLRTVGLGWPEVLKTARRGLRDQSREVRVECARLLGSYQDMGCIHPLLRAMADPHWSVRESAEIALLNFGRDAVGHLTEALKSPSWTTRFRAARLLGELGDDEAVRALQQALLRRGEKKDVREVIESSLRRLAGTAKPG